MPSVAELRATRRRKQRDARGMRVIANAQPQQSRRAWRALGLGVLLGLLAVPLHAAEGGLVLIPEPRMLVTLLVLFMILVVPINALVFRPLLRTLEERDTQISGTRARAERLSQDARGISERYLGSVREAREQAERGRRERIEQTRAEMQETTLAARTDAEGEIDRARAELAASLETARTSLRNEARELAREAASRVLGRAL